MAAVTAFAQLLFTVIVGLYFFNQLSYQKSEKSCLNSDSKREAEELNRLRHIHLSTPLTELTRPESIEDIIGQDDGVRALKAALFGKNPQHVIIYGPPGVGKTAAARAVMEAAKKSEGTPFLPDAKFVETDATTMRFDERAIADPLIGSVHDPIYQGAGAFGPAGIPQPKPGAATQAHGGILFIDEIGELANIQINKLLKVLEDRRVFLESAYYSESNKNIPLYIHDIFQNGLPADFRLIGATTRNPEDIPAAVRSRCMEIHFKALSFSDIRTILDRAVIKSGADIDEICRTMICRCAKNGRDVVRILQTLISVAALESRTKITHEDVKWVLESGRYTSNFTKDLNILNKTVENYGEIGYNGYTGI